ncbi:AsmA family protein [methanotrophic endosymbiont of Bathymodiolus puteoserpentis (Logatchev)]|jgi:AsmA protein|uniref:AsmA family protein n=1 Tax=methanotrophic endosymbiont of Bathymodiolus puteoserpentis (Logatchev) TaxID=343235 RepID=UPI0013CBB3F3|nr:AsmA family protein [methanotrophic endosymbiont of Bathymodiolus puteoserpentis (Logatchev)]SHE22572.1 A/G-specific adenine glycosylase [methanotrophic endosymbiont of Bathymodiolus puteoserpentis (Logatchev)]
MGKLVKGILIFFSTIVALIIAAVVIIPLFVDLNDYKPEIEAAVKDKTGRTLSIEGELDLSIFPWVGVSTGKLILGNASGFKEQPFAVIGESNIKVKLMPLLSKEVEVSTVVLKGLELHLAKDAQGVSNWDDLVGPKEPIEASSGSSEEDSKADTPPALAALAIGGLVIEDSQMSWDDQQSGQHAQIKDFNLKLGAVAFNQPISVKMSLLLENAKPELTEKLSLSTMLVIDESMQRIQLTQLIVDSTTRGEIVSGGTVDAKIQANINVDLEQQKIQLTQFKLDSTVKGGIVPESEVEMHVLSDITYDLSKQIANLAELKIDTVVKGEVVPGGLLDARLVTGLALDLLQETVTLKGLKLNTNMINLTADIAVTQIKSNPQYSGALRIAQFSPKALMQQLKMTVPETTDKQVLQKLAMQFNIQGTTDSIALENLVINLDDTSIKGFTRVKQFKTPAIAFNLAIDTIDVDRYIAPKKEGAAPAPTATPATAVAAATTLLPMETIRGLNITGNLSIAKLKVAKLNMAGVNLKLQAKQGVLTTKQSIKQLYNGRYNGQISINAKGKNPVISLNEKIVGVQLEPLFGDMQPDTPAKIKGAANITAKLNMRGNTIPDIKSTLAGNINFFVTKGAITGFNVQEMLDVGKLFAKGKKMKASYANEQTLFSVLQGTATINKGIINNPDFLLESSTVEVKGAGTVNLVNDALSYKVQAKAKRSSKARPVAIKVSGTFSNPSYTVDALSMITEKEEEKINKAIDKHLGEGAGKAVNKLLKGFF